jgi:uncharacterized protein
MLAMSISTPDPHPTSMVSFAVGHNRRCVVIGPMASLSSKEKYQMSRLYGSIHRSLQDRFDTRRLADNVEARLVLTEISPEHKLFIESRDMFFLSTIDHQGRPTVSYKGGDPGLVRVIDSKAVVFPCYDGNGMFYSMGNLLGNQQVGMLFINFEKPHRLPLLGIASVDDNNPLLSENAEAQLIVRVSVTEIFRNCPRYVHRFKKIQPSVFRRAKRLWHPGSVSMIYRPLYPRRTVLVSNETAICTREQNMKNTSATLRARQRRRTGRAGCWRQIPGLRGRLSSSLAAISTSTSG